MAKERLKNIGLTHEVWKVLKLMTVDRNCTMDEAIRELLKGAGRFKASDAESPKGKVE